MKNYIFAPGLTIMKKTGFMALVAVSDGVSNLVLALVLVPPLGIIGAGIASVNPAHTGGLANDYQVRSGVRTAALAVFRATRRGRPAFCPICQAGTRLLERGGSQMCLRCRSLERHRLMVLYLQRETRLLDVPARLLHLAPEPAVHAVLDAAPELDYVTLDLEPGPLVDVTADARALPFDDGMFDAVVCSHVLSHVPGEHRALAEFARVLRRDGVALVQVPVDDRLPVTYETVAATSEDRLREYGGADHVRVYGRDVLVRFAGAFAAAERVDYAARFLPVEQQRMGLVERTERRGSDIYRLVR